MEYDDLKATDPNIQIKIDLENLENQILNLRKSSDVLKNQLDELRKSNGNVNDPKFNKVFEEYEDQMIDLLELESYSNDKKFEYQVIERKLSSLRGSIK